MKCLILVLLVMSSGHYMYGMESNANHTAPDLPVGNVTLHNQLDETVQVLYETNIHGKVGTTSFSNNHIKNNASIPAGGAAGLNSFIHVGDGQVWGKTIDLTVMTSKETLKSHLDRLGIWAIYRNAQKELQIVHADEVQSKK